VPRLAASAWLFAAGPSLAAPAQEYAISLPAGRLIDSLATLSRQTGVSVGSGALLGRVRVPAVRGRMSVSAALGRLLANSEWRAVAAGPDVWRIVVRAALPVDRSTEPLAGPEPAPPDIVVTAGKRGEALSTMAAPVIVILATRVDALPSGRDTHSVAAEVAGLTVTSLGSGRNRIFLRGIADSPFDGFGQSSVSVQIDETRATYDAPDPDLRLVDMKQVEILEGPQGPLYGTGALGGVYRLVTNKPDATRASGSIASELSSVAHGAVGGSADALINLPLSDRLAVRAVAYNVERPGWINGAGGARNVNHGRTSGGRVAVRFDATPCWTVDAALIGQWSSLADSQYVEGADAGISRARRLPEPLDSDFLSGNVTLRLETRGVKVTSVTSYSTQESSATYDASAAASQLGSVAPASYLDHRYYSVLNQELRAAREGQGRWSWLGGLSLLAAQTKADGNVTSGAGTQPIVRFRRKAVELAAFGEARYALGAHWASTLGLRIFQSSIDDQGDNGSGVTLTKTTLRASPSLALSWQPAGSRLFFLRYASAFRAGGPGITDRLASETPYQSDELQTLDLGARVKLAGDRIALDGDLFATRWSRVQADFLRPDGIVATRNAGRARNLGLELAAHWRPGRGPTFHASVLIQAARLEGSSETVPDRRLPVVPDTSARLSATQGFRLGAWAGAATLRASYVGPSRLSFDPLLDRKTPGYAALGARVSIERAGWQLRLDLDNIADSKADIFAFGNPFSLLTTAQHTPSQPRTLTLAIARRW
jgi:iron complex outermembrane recepter protein